MPVPDRSELPADFVAMIDRQNQNFAERKHILPQLPAEVTPPKVVELAQVLDASIKKHLAQRSIAAEWIENDIREILDSALAGTLTETVPPRTLDTWHIGLTNDIDINQRFDLREAYYTFNRYITGNDELKPEDYDRLIRLAVKARKIYSKRDWGLDLDLTDEEWWAI